MALRIVFFGNSASLFSNRHFGALVQTGCDPVAVVDAPPARRSSSSTQPSGMLAFVSSAAKRGIPVFEPASTQEPEFLAALGNLAPDLFLAVGYPNILRPAALAIPRLAAVNFHASLLPAYRGKHPVFWCLRNGERWSGLTVHIMDAGIDTGDLLYQVRVRTRRDNTVDTLYDRIMVKSVQLISRLVRDAGRGHLRRFPQPEAGRSYFSSIIEEDFRLRWSQEARQLCRWIRMTPGKCFVELAGERIFFQEAEIDRSFPQQAPGRILTLGRVWGTIATGRGALRLGQVRRADMRQLSFPGLCRELGLQAGEQFPCS
jgi:methionyl-tRNA formyltransferase